MLSFKNKRNPCLRFIALICLSVGLASPAAKSAPAHEPEIISAAQISALLAREDVILIDNRPLALFEDGHLPKAVSMTYFESGSTQNQMTRERLEPFKGKTLIFYCSGRNRAYHAAIKAIEWDISPHILWFKGGWNDWQDHLAADQIYRKGETK